MTVGGRRAAMQKLHPELRAGVRFVPRIDVSRWTLGFLRFLAPRAAPKKDVAGTVVEERVIAGESGAPPLRVRVHTATKRQNITPALLWIHGGGHVVGTAGMDDTSCALFARDLGITVIAPEYRLAPEHPFPADLDDCYAALRWMHANATALGIDPACIAIGGISAGGGLAAALAQLAIDRAQIKPVFQLLVYPMLDDRTALRNDIDETGFQFWHQRSNRFAWQAYLGVAPGAADLPAYAAPARRADLRQLPPAWIGVGTLDLFYDEDLDYARRLQESGVACETHVTQGGYHGFDRWSPGATPSREFFASQTNALRRAFEQQTGFQLPGKAG